MDSVTSQIHIDWVAELRANERDHDPWLSVPGLLSVRLFHSLSIFQRRQRPRVISFAERLVASISGRSKQALWRFLASFS